jgi:hypothetical protein
LANGAYKFLSPIISIFSGGKMLVFQYSAPAQGKKEELTPSLAARLLLKENGYIEIASMMKTNPEQLKFFIQNKQFHMVLREPDKFPPAMMKNLVENMTRLGDDPAFINFLTNAMVEPAAGIYLRRLVGDLYNSDTGKKALEGMEHLMRSLGNTAISFLAPPHAGVVDIPFGINNMLRSYEKVPDEYLRVNYEYFKYPEREIHVKDMPPQYQRAYAALLDYAKTGNKAKSEEFLKFSGASELFRTQEIRTFLLDVLINRPTVEAERLAEVLFSSKGRAIVKNAAETPEGVNTVGYLWNSSGVNRFFDVWGKNVVNGTQTIMMLMGAQGEYRKKHGPGYQQGEAWQENKVKLPGKEKSTVQYGFEKGGKQLNFVVPSTIMNKVNESKGAFSEKWETSKSKISIKSIGAIQSKHETSTDQGKSWSGSFAEKMGLLPHTQELNRIFEASKLTPEASEQAYRTCMAYAAKMGWIEASHVKKMSLNEDELKVLKIVSAVWHGQGGPKAQEFFSQLKDCDSKQILQMAQKGAGETETQLTSYLNLKSAKTRRAWDSLFQNIAE